MNLSPTNPVSFLSGPVNLLGAPITLLGEPAVDLFTHPVARIIGRTLQVASIAASAYHGGRRHGGSVAWAVGWGVLGGLFPVITPAVAAAQGYGKCKFDCGRR